MFEYMFEYGLIDFFAIGGDFDTDAGVDYADDPFYSEVLGKQESE